MRPLLLVLALGFAGCAHFTESVQEESLGRSVHQELDCPREQIQIHWVQPYHLADVEACGRRDRWLYRTIGVNDGGWWERVRN